MNKKYKYNVGYELHCFGCDKAIELIIIGVDRLELGMWEGGVVGQIEANYGSNLDGDTYTIAICDLCLKNKKNKKDEKTN